MIKSLYVHIPFCVKKCLYCDFNSFASPFEIHEQYIDSIINEIDSVNVEKFQTIFIGGGTPTILSLNNMEKLLKKLSSFTPGEFTVEANPGTLNDDKLKLMKFYGVNRLSIGLQAWQDNLLRGLGRIHTLEEFLRNYERARRCDFNNINIDLMFGIPDQNIGDWIETVENIAKLNPEHVSAYSLIVEEGTPFYEMNEKGSLNVIDEDSEREMYHFATKYFEKSGLRKYEISNFAKAGFECRHNITYWQDEEYIGVGAGAHSYVSGVRYNNKYTIMDYIQSVKSESVKENQIIISSDDEMSEFMFMGLRMIEGINKQRFVKRFGIDLDKIYHNELQELKALGLIDETPELISLTRKGIDLSNQVFIKFLTN